MYSQFVENAREASRYVGSIFGQVSPEEELLRRAIMRENHHSMLDREGMTEEIQKLNRIKEKNINMINYYRGISEDIPHSNILEEFYENKNRDINREIERYEHMIAFSRNRGWRTLEEGKEGDSERRMREAREERERREAEERERREAEEERQRREEELVIQGVPYVPINLAQAAENQEYINRRFH
jgi:hypothetical protein